MKKSTCANFECIKHPSFGIAGTKTPIFCSIHKPTEYVDVVSAKCIDENCSKLASYGIPHTTKRLYCAAHKSIEHIDLRNTLCSDDGCRKCAIYGIPNTTKAITCAEHRYDGLVDIKSAKCIHPECTTRPCYGVKGTKKALYCFAHKNVDHVDVKNTQCTVAKCFTRPSFGFAGYSAEYCAEHRLEGMVANPKKRKRTEDTICAFCSTPVHYTEEYCSGCKEYQANGNVTKKRKTKELAVKTLLENAFGSDFAKHDQRVEDGCSRRRPDFLITGACTWGNVIVEVDEFQHMRNTYPCECEVTRMKQIYHDCGVQNVLFIRYNPDTYKTLDVAAERPMARKKREDFLVRFIRKHIEGPKLFESPLGVVYLFYDGFSVDSVEIEALDPYDIK